MGTLTILLWIAAIGYGIYIWHSRKNEVVGCDTAIAGSLSSVSGGGEEELDNISHKEFKGFMNTTFKIKNTLVDIRNYMLFVIYGNSMEPLGLKSGTIAIVKRLSSEDKYNIPSKSVVIIQIDTDRSKKEGKKITKGFKARQFLGYCNFSDSDDEIIKKLFSIEPKLKEKETTYESKLRKKLRDAREYFGEFDNMAVSLTYKDGRELDFSIHLLTDFIGSIAFIIPDKIFDFKEKKIIVLEKAA